MTKMKESLFWFAVVLATTAAYVLGYFGLWWLTKDSVDRSTRIDNRSFAVQRSNVAQARDYIIDSESEAITEGQRINIVRRACGLINDLTINVPNDLATFAAKEC